ncbi:hypothetical protein H8F21_28790 [Pseudomonas sp. P66]|uniref:Glycosyltransferase RgtA/B/C/D-like domain-containing protein n=1 Tax=Pseudomonas arcuscaelestis TaxID=2710591 RepID=A0ABS2C895_9PSED|nr:hypothetical protein [Pseudomonas arcuscaelestis]MBM5461558.1 hypothetical protein [Pseudomonas arcuscaelestis]
MTIEHSFRRYATVCYLLTGVIFAILFVENFIFSSDFTLLGFRSYDDVGFQASLRRAHLILQAGDWPKFFILNDYAYGWVFWATIALITYPLFLLEQSFSIAWPLIVTPRQLSLLFGVMCLMVMHKLLKQLKVPSWACAGAVLIFALFPSMGYFSLRFGTVNAVTFFSLLALYYALKQEKSTTWGVTRVALSLAIAGAIKLSGLLIAPLIALLLLRRLDWSRAVKTLVPPLIVFLLVLGVMINPSFLLIPSAPHFWIDYLNDLQKFLEVTRIPEGPANPVERFYYGVFRAFGAFLAMLLLMFGWFIAMRQDRSVRSDFLAIIAIFVSVAIYLAVSVKNVSSVGSYFTGISFVLLLGVVGYARSSSGPRVLGVIISLLFLQQLFLLNKGIQSETPGMSHASYFIAKEFVEDDVALATSALACVKEHSNGASVGQILIDFTVPVAINSISHPETCLSMAWDNLSPARKYCGSPVDFLILDAEKAVGFLPAELFDEKIKSTNATMAEVYREDRKNRELLINQGEFGNQHYTQVCDLGRLKIFKADTLLSK